MIERDYYGQLQPPHDCEAPDVIHQFEMYEASEEISKHANYNGNWSMLLRNRLIDPVSIRKYVLSILQDNNINEGDPPFIEEREKYLLRIEKAFNSTKYGDADTFSDEVDKPEPIKAGGVSSVDEVPIVYADAVNKDGKELNINQKSIVEAHEQAHVVLGNMPIEQRDYLLGLFNDSYISQFVNKNDCAGEIIAKVTQIKNYFGMNAGDKVTISHIEYMNKFYERDTGFDNSLMTLINSIKPDRKDSFIRLINLIAC